MVSAVLLAIEIVVEFVGLMETEPAADVLTTDSQAVSDSLTRVITTAQQLMSAAIIADHSNIEWWVKERSLIWFDYYLWSSYDDARWIRTLRMPKDLFMQLVHLLEPHIAKQDTRFRKAVPVFVRVGAALFRLATGMNHFHIGERFGIGETTSQEVFREVVDSIVSVLGPIFVRWPQGEELARVADGFYRKCGLPNCHGAIDGTHIRIRSPQQKELPAEFFNRKQYHSLVLQCICDTDGLFLDVSCGRPGSVHDRRVLRLSSFYTNVRAGSVLAEPVITLPSGFRLQPYILGDSGYTMARWLMPPYLAASRGNELHALFTERQVRGRICIEQAFGVLKGRFQILTAGITSSIGWAARVVQACCILHNFLVRNRVHLDRATINDHTLGRLPGGVTSLRAGDSGSEVREALAEFLALGSS